MPGGRPRKGEEKTKKEDKFKCNICGSILTSQSIPNHYRTWKHMKFVAQLPLKEQLDFE